VIEVILGRKMCLDIQDLLEEKLSKNICSDKELGLYLAFCRSGNDVFRESRFKNIVSKLIAEVRDNECGD
jgi:hypothetical protein